MSSAHVATSLSAAIAISALRRTAGPKKKVHFRVRLVNNLFDLTDQAPHSRAHRDQYTMGSPQSRQLPEQTTTDKTHAKRAYTRHTVTRRPWRSAHTHTHKPQYHRTWPRKCPLIHTKVRLHFSLPRAPKCIRTVPPGQSCGLHASTRYTNRARGKCMIFVSCNG